MSRRRAVARTDRARPGPALCGWLCVALLVLAVFAPGRAAASIEAELRTRLAVAEPSPLVAATDEDRRAVAQFYAARAYRPLWVDGAAATPRARTLAEALARADLDGLDPRDYGVPPIQALLDADGPAKLAELELRLSLALLHFAGNLEAGRTVPSQVDPEHFIYPRDIDRLALLNEVDGSGDVGALIGRHQPQTAEYARLKTALAAYRNVAAAGGWTPLPEGPTFKPGMTDPRVPLLRARLLAWGDLQPGEDATAAGGDPEFFDPGLETGVKRFQRRHGLDPDGAIGTRALAALNVPVGVRIDQIQLNLERRRWMPDDYGATYVLVNLADYTLRLVKGGQQRFETRVVVGTPVNRTPVFSSRMTHVVLNPDWSVPLDIARKEILPKVKRDPTYLSKENYTLLGPYGGDSTPIDPLTVDWQRYTKNYFPFRLRQEPGANNALGKIKFVFPNRFDIYMHDTPSRALFGRAQRTFSHGCIRVQNPERFAEILLEERPAWSPEAIQAAIAEGGTLMVPLAKPVPVHLTYLTAWVDEDGKIQFRDDVYGRDRRLGKALLEARNILH